MYVFSFIFLNSVLSYDSTKQQPLRECFIVYLHFQSCALSSFRFFLMYLINKDETEHTGQVSEQIQIDI